VGAQQLSNVSASSYYIIPCKMSNVLFAGYCL
jgi:hypothetical protein